MGNKQSKILVQERLEELERRCTTASETIATQGHQLARKDEELAGQKSRLDSALTEIDTLQQKLKEMAKDSIALEEARAQQNVKLQADLNRKVNECVGQRRQIDNLTGERDGVRKQWDEAQDGTKTLELEHETLTKDSQAREKELHAARQEYLELDEKAQQLRATNNTLEKELTNVNSALTEEKQERGSAEEALSSTTKKLANSESNLSSLRQEYQALTEKWLAAEATASDESQKRSTAEEQLATTKHELTSSCTETANLRERTRTLKSDLDTLQATAATDSQERSTLEEELAGIRKQLAFSDSKRDDLQRTHNEGVSKRAAMHETLQAYKAELKDTHEQYRKLQDSNSTLVEKLEGLQRKQNPALANKSEQKSGGADVSVAEVPVSSGEDSN